MKAYSKEKFLDLAKLGKNKWWRYVVAILNILTVWYIGVVTTAIFLMAWVKTDNNPATNFNPEVTFQFEGLSPQILVLYVNAGFFFLLLGLYITVRHIHRRFFLSLITTKKRINWTRIAQAFIISFLMQTLAIVLAYFVDPNSFQLTFKIDSFLSFLPIAFFIVPIQTSVEELFYRGYLMQAISLIARKPIIPVLFSSVLFMIVHLRNPEVLSQKTTIGSVSIILSYFISGLFLAIVTVKDNSLELALGFHAAKNIGVSLFVSANNSVVPSPAIFSIGEIEGSLISIFALLSKYIVFYWLVFRVFPKPSTIDSHSELT